MYLKSAWKKWCRSLRSGSGRGQSRRRDVRRREVVAWSAEVLEARQLLSSITVNSLADNTTSGDGQITLREALLAANTNASVDGSVAGQSGVQDTIVFEGGLAGGVELNAALGALVITDSVRIEASGATRIVIDARGESRVFDIGASAGDVTFAGLSITGGQTTSAGVDGAGAGIRAQTSGTVTLETVELSNNHTSGAAAHGAGLYAGLGNVVMINSTVAENTAVGAGAQGGGIYAAAGVVTATNSTISGNSAATGGGLFSLAADVNLRSTTVTNNTAANGGGLSLFNGSLSLSNSIVAGNDASVAADDIQFTNNGGLETATAVNSLIGINAGTAFLPSPGGSVADAQGNFIGTLATPIDAQLDVLSGNGGQTRTHALLAGSLAINSGSNAQANALGLTVDQRGTGSARIDGTVDMGAVETHAALPVLVVKVANDELDADLSNSADLSLREAISIANSTFGADTIVFDLALNGTPLIVSLGELAITDTLTITGNGANNTVIDAQGSGRVLDGLWGAIDLTLNGLTVTRGRVTGTVEGGAGVRFLSPGRLELNDVEISNSSVVGVQSRGAAIFANPGDMVITNSLVTNNSVQGNLSSAGGIFSHLGTVTVINSTISGNAAIGATVNGSAILTDSASASINLVNSTVTANLNNGDATSRGAVVAVRGSISIANSIVAGNTVTGIGEIDVTFANFDGTATFTARNSIIGVNLDTPLAGTGGVVGANGNFVGTSGAAFNAQLAPLADNGGPTRTHALLGGSAALNAGNNSLAVNADGSLLLTDQRGGAFIRLFAGTVDIGAYEQSNVQAGFDQTLALEGFYFDGVNLAVVMRSGAQVTFKNGSGVLISGEVVDSTHLIATGLGNLDVEFDAQAGTLTFANGTVWTKVPRLSGIWIDDGGAQIIVGQLATDLDVHFSGGANVTGTVHSPTQVTVGGITGTLSNDGQHIEFTNGAAWDLVADISGGYVNNSGDPVAIVQAGTSLKIVSATGVVTNAQFTDGNSLLLTGGVTAEIAANGTITFSDGRIWVPTPAAGTNTEISGVYDVNVGGSARIIQADDDLTIINEVGASFDAHFVSSTEIVVDSTGVRGFISGDVILWTDGKIYTQIPDLSGPRLDLLGNETRVDQLDRDLILTSSTGVVTHAQIINQTQFVETDGAMRTGTIAGNTLIFSDGAVWAELPDLRGNWVMLSNLDPTFIEQAGASVLLVTDLGVLVDAQLLSPNILHTELPLGGGGSLGTNVVASVSGNTALYFNNGWLWTRPAANALDAVFADPAQWPFV